MPKLFKHIVLYINSMTTIGKVYKIYSQKSNEVYIGSTTKLLLQRFLQHKKNYKSYNKGKYHFVTSFHILEYDDANIELIEEVQFDDKKELIKRERFHIEQNDCVNKRVEGRTRKEYREDNKQKIQELQKQYYEANKQKLLEQNKEYREDNKQKRLEYLKKYRQANIEKISEKEKEYREQNREKISEKNKKYREQNREKMQELQKQYYEANKQKLLEKLKEKITCECGSVVRKSDIRRHEKSIKHQKYLETIV